MTTQSALNIWNNMNPTQRADVMEKVGYMKSITKRFRLCIEHIQAAA
jgi:hypothetical protein